jgi:NAD(P) transhydrogenase subunit alpha
MTDSSVTEQLRQLAEKTAALEAQANIAGGIDPLVFGLFVFVLACFVGYYVVWRVTPALHTPLMAVTNAISGIIVVGAMIAVGANAGGFSSILGFLAVVIASINIFGGFVVTQRMLEMFKKKERKDG